MSEIKLMIGEEIVKELLENNPEVEVEIKEKIISNTSKRIIKKIVNDEDVEKAVFKKLDAIIDQAAIDICTKTKNLGWKTSYELSDSFKKHLIALIEKEINCLFKYKITRMLDDDETMREILDGLVSKAFIRYFDSCNFQEFLIGRIDVIAKAAIREKLGLDK